MSAVRRRKISAKYRKIVGRSWGTGVELEFRRAPLTFTQQEAKLDQPEKIAIGRIDGINGVKPFDVRGEKRGRELS